MGGLTRNPLRWLLGGNKWIPEVNETCRMKESYRGLTKGEFVVIEVPPLDANDDNVTVSSLLGGTRETVPLSMLNQCED